MVDERDDTLYIRTNDTHVNFRIVTAPVSSPGTWTELIAGDEHHYILSCDKLRKSSAWSEERVDGLSQIRLRDYDERRR